MAARGYLARLFAGDGPGDNRSDPAHPFWYGAVSALSEAGVPVTDETALKTSAVYAAFRLVSTAIAMVPVRMREDLGEGKGKRVAKDHPIDALLHRKPNAWQNSFRFRQLMQGRVMLRGNAYAQIVPGPDGPFGQLVPRHPDRTRVGDQKRDGTLEYVWRDREGEEHRIPQERMFHLRGPSMDGISGLSVIQQMRNAVGLAQATEKYAATYFRRGISPAVILKHPGELDPEGVVAKSIANQFGANWGGVDNAHGALVLEEGMDAVNLGFTAEDAQLLLSRAFQVEDLLRFLGVHGYLVGYPDKNSTYASAEQAFIAFQTFCLQPAATNWEQEIIFSLVLEPDRFYPKFGLDSLVRTELAARTEAEAKMIQYGIRSQNEVREIEDLPPKEGGDELLTPVATAQKDSAAPQPRPVPKDSEEEDEAPPPRPRRDRTDRAQAIVRESAARVVRRELAQVSTWSRRFASDAAGWKAWVEKFYGEDEHQRHLEEALCLEPAAASRWCSEQRAALLSGGVAAAQGWELDRVAALAALALGE